MESGLKVMTQKIGMFMLNGEIKLKQSAEK